MKTKKFRNHSLTPAEDSARNTLHPCQPWRLAFDSNENGASLRPAAPEHTPLGQRTSHIERIKARRVQGLGGGLRSPSASILFSVLHNLECIQCCDVKSFRSLVIPEI